MAKFNLLNIYAVSIAPDPYDEEPTEWFFAVACDFGMDYSSYTAKEKYDDYNLGRHKKALMMQDFLEIVLVDWTGSDCIIYYKNAPWDLQND